MRLAQHQVYTILAPIYPKLSVEKGISRVSPDTVGAQPDGGMWYHDGKLIAAFEAKHQGQHGNAAERWFKNYYLLSKRNPRISYVTFSTGDGAKEGSTLRRTFNTCLHEEGLSTSWNVLNIQSVSFFGAPLGFDLSQVTATMRDCIETSILRVAD